MGKAYGCIFKSLFLFKGHILKAYKTGQIYINTMRKYKGLIPQSSLSSLFCGFEWMWNEEHCSFKTTLYFQHSGKPPQGFLTLAVLSRLLDEKKPQYIKVHTHYALKGPSLWISLHTPILLKQFKWHLV